MVRQPHGKVAERFTHLQQTIYPQGGKPLTQTEICDGINALAKRNVMSKPYLSQIASGARPKPSHEKLAWIARFFGVSTDYFSDDGAAATADESLMLAQALRDHGVVALALRFQGMNTAQLHEALGMLDALRTRDGLPGIGTPPPAQPS